MRARRKTAETEVVRWTGANAGEVLAFTGPAFEVLCAQDRLSCIDPLITAQVYDHLHCTWIALYDGDWIIKGPDGEFHPCRAAVFPELYELVGDPALEAGEAG